LAGRVLGLLIGFLCAILLVTISVANRHAVRLSLDPFDPQNPLVAIVLPFYAYVFAALIAGIVLGGASTWLSQGKWRRIARNRTQEALRWRAEAERLIRERDASVVERKQLAAAGR
jgi:uncharacterized integral membrane protein